MISENKYNDLERYISQEMANEEKTAFESEVAKNKELAQYLEVYQELPKALHHIRKDERFKQQLQAAKNDYVASAAPKSSNLRWVVLVILLALASFLVWQFGWKGEEKQEPEPIFAQAFTDTDKPLEEIQRGSDGVTNDIQLYNTAFDFYENENYSATLLTLDSITPESSTYPAALELKGYVQYLQNDYQEAINTFNLYLQQENIERDMILWYQVFAYFKNNQIEETKTNLQVIIDQNYPQAPNAEKLLKTLN